MTGSGIAIARWRSFIKSCGWKTGWKTRCQAVCGCYFHLFSLMMAVPRRTSHWDEASTRLVEQLEPLHQHPGAEPTWKKLCRKTQSSVVKHGEAPSFTIFPWNSNVDYLIHIFADYFSKSTVTFKRDDLLHRLHLHVLDSHREVHLDFSLYGKGPRCQEK